MTDSQIFDQIAESLNLSAKQIKKVADFIDEGATIPFLARYRQEATGGLDEEQLRSVRDQIDLHRTLEDRKKTILKAIDEQDKLTEELEKKIKSCKDLKTLEDLGPYMQHVFVRNWGLCDDWTHVDEDKEFQSALQQYQVPIIDLPKFPYAERNFIEANQLTLSGALNHTELNLVSRQRVFKFLQKSFNQIESTGFLNEDS